MLEVKNINKTYRPKKGAVVHAINNVSLKFEETGMVFILGKSGSGKSTFLNLVGGLDSLDRGEVIIKGKSSKDFTQADFDSYRNTFIGFIFQEYNLLNEFSVGKNIALALELQGKKAGEQEVNDILSKVDLNGYMNRKPSELSGGQKQRVAIARALIKDPEIIMADEPTGALDSNTGKQVFETLQKLSKEKLVIIVSHDREYAEYYGDRVIEFSDGKIISDIKKYKISGDELSQNIKIIDGKILRISPGATLSSEEKSAVVDFLTNSSEETIICRDERSNRELRRVSRIDDNGNREAFDEVSDDKLSLKEYTPNDFKLIRSKLPFKHKVAIGANSLKVKPFRLVLTILLSAIAFAMFGLVDTLGAYNKIDVTYNSMLESDINYASFAKHYGIAYFDDYITWENYPMTDSEYKEIEEQFPDYVFDKIYQLPYGGTSIIYNFYEYYQRGFAPGPYYTHQTFGSDININGFIEVENGSFDDRGYSIVGRYPSSLDEIMISRHYYNMFVDLSLADFENTDSDGNPTKIPITSEASLIGKRIIVGSVEFKIVGIVDTNFPESRYESLKESISYNSFLDLALPYELYSMSEHCYHTMVFVNTGFKDYVDSIIEQQTFYDFSISGYYLYADIRSQNVNYTGTAFNSIAAFDESMLPYIKFFDNNKTTLADDEVVLNFNSVSWIFQNNNYDSFYYYPLIAELIKPKILSLDSDELEQFKNYIAAILGYSVNDFLDYEYVTVLQYLFSDYLTGLVESPEGFFSDRFDEYLMTASADFLADILDYMDGHLNSTLHIRGSIQGLKIVGVSCGVPSTDDGYITVQDDYMITTKASKEYIIENFGQIKAAITTLSGIKSKDIELIKYSYNENLQNDYLMMYILKNAVSDTINMINAKVELLSSGFLIGGFILALFASLMLLNFISVSISYKKREIGILRAVGAKSSDVFGIFFSEAAIIALISFFFGAIGAGIGSAIINSVLRGEIGLLISILNFTFRQVLLILFVSLFTAFVSSFFPVFKTANKKPVEAIRNS